MLLTILFTCFAVTATKIVEPEKFLPNTLELLHIVFRHGDRTPDDMYPKDPYVNDSFEPIGVGRLTNPGKNRMFRFGQRLRDRYGSFIDEMYTPDILYTTASHYPRCRSSLALVLAGLFPLELSKRWNPIVPWDPIAYDYIPEDRNIMFSPWSRCPHFYNLFNKYMQGKTFRDLYPGFRDIGPYLKINTGTKYENLANLTTSVYAALKAEEELGLALPEWTKSVYPQPLQDLSGIGWRHWVGDDDLKTLGAGLLMNEILKNTEAKINGNTTERRLKLCLYSGHDYTVAALLRLLDMYDNRNPNYGSSVTIEVHNYHGDRYVRVIERNDLSSPNIREISIPKCGRVCPLGIFAALSAKYRRIDRIKALCS